MAKKSAPHHRRQPIAVLIVKPVTARLARLESLLVEIRHEQDVKLKRLRKLEDALDALSDLVTAKRQSRGPRAAVASSLD
jgi:hypothetical protein